MIQRQSHQALFYVLLLEKVNLIRLDIAKSAFSWRSVAQNGAIDATGIYRTSVKTTGGGPFLSRPDQWSKPFDRTLSLGGRPAREEEEAFKGRKESNGKTIKHK